jgi:hypothetical protein
VSRRGGGGIPWWGIAALILVVVVVGYIERDMVMAVWRSFGVVVGSSEGAGGVP